jgi:hypothetical protein
MQAMESESSSVLAPVAFLNPLHTILISNIEYWIGGAGLCARPWYVIPFRSQLVAQASRLCRRSLKPDFSKLYL